MIILAVFLASLMWLQAEPVLKTLKRAHPRILVDDAAIARMEKLARSDPHGKRWYAAIRADADRILAAPPSHYEIPDGRRLLSVSRQVKERVQTLALVYWLERDRHYLDRLWKEVESAAGFKDWNPSHFLDTAEMTYAFGIAYDWFHSSWSDPQRRTLRQAIVDLGLKPGLQVYQSARGWHTNVNNWNQVCNGGLSIGALAIADEEPELAEKILEHALRSVPLAMNHYAPDGAGTEGATYWDYGARYNILMLASLQTALGKDFGLARNDIFSKSGAYQIYLSGANRLAFDFADCGLRRLSTPMHFWMARQYRLPEYSWFRLSEIDRPEEHGSFLDFLWYDGSGRNL